MNAVSMVNDCFRHQHPEAYGKEAVDEGYVPVNLRYGNSPTPRLSPTNLPEEDMGYPQSRQLEALT